MNIRRFSFYALCLLCLVQCKKDSDSASPSPIVEQPLSTEEGDATPSEINNLIDQLPYDNPPLDSLYFEDGQSIKSFLENYKKKNGGRLGAGADATSPTEQKKMLISVMGVVARRLCDRSQFQIPAETIGNPPQPSTEAPAQNGLAYSYGQDKYKIRAFPAPPEKRCYPQDRCPFRLQGLDCSGFITNLIREAQDPSSTTDKALFSGIVKEHSSTLGTVDYWNLKVLKQDKRFTNITTKNMGQLPASDLQPGDIIYFTKGHIGFVLSRGKDANGIKKLAVYQSNGVQSDNNCDEKETGQCKSNYTSPTRGVHPFTGNQKQIDAFKSTGAYRVLRFSEPEQYLTCKINDQQADFPIASDAYFISNQKKLRVIFLSADRNQYIGFDIDGFNQQPKTFGLEPNSSTAYYSADKKNWSSLIKGTVIITSSTAEIIEGNFEFIVDPGGAGLTPDYFGTGRKVITEGVFRAKYRTTQ